LLSLKNISKVISLMITFSVLLTALPGLSASATITAVTNQSFYEDFEGYSEATFTNSPTTLANQQYNGWNMRVQWGGAASVTALNLLPVDTTAAAYNIKNGSTALKMNVEVSAVAAPQLAKDPGIVIGTEDIIISGDMYLPKVNTSDSRQYARFFISRGIDGATVAADIAEFGLSYTPLVAPAFGLFIDSDNANDWTVKLATPSKIKTNDEKSTGIKLAEETWYNLCYIYHPVTGEVDYYIDGKKIASHPTGQTHGGVESYYIPDLKSGKALGAVNLVGGGNQSTTDDLAVMFDNISVVTASAIDAVKYGEYENGADYVYANWDIPVDKTTIANENIIVEKMADSDILFSGEGATVVSDYNVDFIGSNGIGISFVNGLTEAYARYKVTVLGLTDVYGNTVDKAYNFVTKDAFTAYGTFDETFDSDTSGWAGNHSDLPVTYETSEDGKSGVIKASPSAAYKQVISPTSDADYFNLPVNSNVEYVELAFDLKAKATLDTQTDFAACIMLLEGNGNNVRHTGISLEEDRMFVAAKNGAYINASRASFSESILNSWKSYKLRYYPSKGKLDLFMANSQNGFPETPTVSYGTYTSASGGNVNGEAFTWNSTAHGNKIKGLSIQVNTLNTDVFIDNVSGASYGCTSTGATLKGATFETADGRMLDRNFAGAKTVKVYMDKATTAPIAGFDEVTHTGTFDSATGVYTMMLDEMLLGNSEYTLVVDSVPYTFITDSGEFRVSNLRFKDDSGETVSGRLVNGNVTASVEMFNSTVETETAYLVWAAYNGSELKYIDVKKLDVVGGFDETVDGLPLGVTDEYTRIKAFLFNGFDKLMPLLEDITLDKNEVFTGGFIPANEQCSVFVGDFDDNGTAKISGSFSKAIEGQYVNVVIFAPEKNESSLSGGTNQKDIIVYADSTKTDKDGKFIFEITLSGASGEYSAYFGPAAGNEVLEKVPVYFSNKAENELKLTELYTKAQAVATDSATGNYDTEDIAEFSTFVDSNKDALAFRFSLYDDASGVNHTSVAKLLVRYLKEKTAFDATKRAEMTGAFKTLVVMQAFMEDKITDIDEYSSQLPIFANNNGVLKKWYSRATADELAELTSRLDASTFGTVSDFEKKAVEGAVLARIHYADGEADVENALKDFEKYTGISTSGLGLAVYDGLERNSYADYKALSDAVTALKKKPNNGSGNGGGGGGGAGGGGSTATKLPSVSIEEGYYADEQKTPLVSESKGFKDVTENDWYYDAVYELYDRGIISGKDKNTFAPDASITREEIVKMLAVMQQLTLDDAGAVFADVKSGDWFCAYVNAAAKAGIVNGIGEGLFGAGQNVTRQDIAVMLYNIAVKNGTEAAEETEEVFVDAESISDYAKTAVRTLNGLNVINGYDDGSFKPQNFVTRAEAAKLIREFLYINK